MPTSVRTIFDSAGLVMAGDACWGERIASGAAGVYAITLDADPDRTDGLARPLFCDAAIGRWIATTPWMRLDGDAPSAGAIRDYLSGFWLPDEPVLYIGRAASLRSRLRQFVRHELGKRSPHAGGHWLKALAAIDSLHVFYAETSGRPEAADGERSAILRFVDGVCPETASTLTNPTSPIPFANVVHPGVGRKQRLFVNQTAPRST